MSIISTILGSSNPVAAVVDSTVGKVVDKALAFIPDPVQQAKFKIDLKTLDLNAEASQIVTINQTMQHELDDSDKEAWYQKAWRPANGFCVALGSLVAVIFTCYLFYCGIFSHQPEAIGGIPALASAIALILAVPGSAVGIAAWHSGQLERESNK